MRIRLPAYSGLESQPNGATSTNHGCLISISLTGHLPHAKWLLKRERTGGGGLEGGVKQLAGRGRYLHQAAAVSRHRALHVEDVVPGVDSPHLERKWGLISDPQTQVRNPKDQNHPVPVLTGVRTPHRRL